MAARYATWYLTCPICKDAHKFYEEYLDHVRLWHNILQYPCRVHGCVASFHTKDEHSAHMAAVHEAPLRCGVVECHCTFASHSELEKHHQHVHQLGLYRCEAGKCYEYFSKITYLYEHQEQGHGLFFCHICDISFFTQYQLSYHVRTTKAHRTTPPYRCSFPNCTFPHSSKYTISNHIVLAHGERPSDYYEFVPE